MREGNRLVTSFSSSSILADFSFHLGRISCGFRIAFSQVAARPHAVWMVASCYTDVLMGDRRQKFTCADTHGPAGIERTRQQTERAREEMLCPEETTPLGPHTPVYVSLYLTVMRMIYLRIGK